jgi:hypothetical protein
VLPRSRTLVPALLRAQMKHSHGAQRISCFTFRLISSLSDFFTGKLSPDFDLKNIILTYTTDFSWKKWPKFARFRKYFFFQIPQILIISSIRYLKEYRMILGFF